MKCTCDCTKLYPKLKIYDHLKEAEFYIDSLEQQIKLMDEFEDTPYFKRLPFTNGRFDAKRALAHLKVIHDKYAKDLGWNDEE